MFYPLLLEVEIDGKKYYPNIGSQYALTMSIKPEYCGVVLFNSKAELSQRHYSNRVEGPSVTNDLSCDEQNQLIIDIDKNKFMYYNFVKQRNYNA